MAGEQMRRDHPLYGRWGQIKQTIYNPNSADYPRNGGAGIGIYEPWNEFANFENDINALLGLQPGPGYKLARKDQKKDWEPKNIEWALQSTIGRRNSNSIMIKIGRNSKNIREWCVENNISYDTAITRIKKLKWDPKKAVTVPVRPKSDSSGYDKKLKRSTRINDNIKK
jgi:hypothetical protein